MRKVAAAGALFLGLGLMVVVVLGPERTGDLAAQNEASLAQAREINEANKPNLSPLMSCENEFYDDVCERRASDESVFPERPKRNDDYDPVDSYINRKVFKSATGFDDPTSPWSYF